MRDYRFLLLDRQLKAVRFLECSCLDDASAMVLADAVGANHAVDVWHADRFVGGVRPEGAEEPAFGTPIEPAAQSEQATTARPAAEPRLDA